MTVSSLTTLIETTRSHHELSVCAGFASSASPCATACQQPVCAAAAAAAEAPAHITSVPGMASQNATHAAGSPAKHGTARQTSVADTHAVTQRLQSELMSLMSNADPGVSAFPAGDSLFSWLGTVKVGFTMWSLAACTQFVSTLHHPALAVRVRCNLQLLREANHCIHLRHLLYASCCLRLRLLHASDSPAIKPDMELAGHSEEVGSLPVGSCRYSVRGAHLQTQPEISP